MTGQRDPAADARLGRRFEAMLNRAHRAEAVRECARQRERSMTRLAIVGWVRVSTALLGGKDATGWHAAPWPETPTARAQRTGQDAPGATR